MGRTKAVKAELENGEFKKTTGWPNYVLDRLACATALRRDLSEAKHFQAAVQVTRRWTPRFITDMLNSETGLLYIMYYEARARGKA